ncbi:MAG TPA: nickel pincer cofactor biosynthesis protein LarC [Acidimicrobiales bacterium]|nr:nickel pincer cofactor biosynthesis protein LarC [Acidimicrobiales bacterium]
MNTDGGPRTVAWFHCFAGIAGDMALGSLLDAGADFDQVLALLERLPFGGWALERQSVLRGGIAATQAVVTVNDSVVVRTHAHIVGLVEEARLPERVTRRALATFSALAEVEARLHHRSVDQVHFHEVGGHDTIVDVVGTIAALEVLGVDEVESSPVATGMGMVRSAHGMLPNPAPAVVALLEGMPTWGRDLAVELTTPTGAALLAALATGFGPMPPMRVTTNGFGAGTRDLDELPNLTQVVIGTRIDLASGDDSPAGVEAANGSGAESHGGSGGSGHPEADAGQPVLHLEANVDDATGEQLAHAVSELLEAGAHDAWLSPVVMKKGRPGTVVHVLCDQSAGRRLRQVLRAETGTLGVRATTGERWPASRRFDTVEVDGSLIRMKVSPGRVKAEHEDVARAARRNGQTLREVAFRAEAAWRQRQETPSD